MICKSSKRSKIFPFCLSSVLCIFFSYCAEVAVCLPRTIPPSLGFHLNEARLSPHCPCHESGEAEPLFLLKASVLRLPRKGHTSSPAPGGPHSHTTYITFPARHFPAFPDTPSSVPSNVCFCLGGGRSRRRQPWSTIENSGERNYPEKPHTEEPEAPCVAACLTCHVHLLKSGSI